MRTQVMHDAVMALPWLQRAGCDALIPEQTVIDASPFVIGRNDSANLALPLNRVSREHAAIVRDGLDYRIRDLGSTNGTFLNGQRIQEAVLTDGDLLAIADVEFSFCCRSGGAPRETATQVIGFGRSGDASAELARDMVHQVRRIQELVVGGGLRSRFERVVSLDNGRPWAYEAVDDESALPGPAGEARRMVLAADGRWTARLRFMQRMHAAAAIGSLGQAHVLFVRIAPVELGDPALADTLEQVRDALPPGIRLAVHAPESALSEVAAAQEFLTELRDLEIGICAENFVAGQAGLFAEESTRPDYVMLGRPLARGIDQSPRRQAQLETLLRQAQSAGVEAIASGLERREDAEVCRALGCRFGQGALYGTAP